jgi:dienelactone hydrolase
MPSIRHCVAAALVASVILSSASLTIAQTLTAETRGKVEFAAPTFANMGEFYRNAPSSMGKAAIDIRLPEGDGPFPAVIISHTVGGFQPEVEGDAMRRLLAAGYAVGALDHFGPRGLQEATGGGFATPAAASDALIALRLLATHPRIDSHRIAMIGFSMGGQAAQNAAYEPIRRRFAGDARFAAFVSFYGPCSSVALDGPRTLTGAPVLLLFGGKDETTTRERCDQIEALVRAVQPEAPLRAIWYPNAHHAWNQPKFRRARFLSHHRSTRACPLIDYGASFGFIRPDGSREPFTPATFNECLRAGAGYTVGHDADVTEQSWRDAIAFLNGHLKS